MLLIRYDSVLSKGIVCSCANDLFREVLELNGSLDLSFSQWDLDPHSSLS